MTRRFNRTTRRPVGPSCRGLPVLIRPLLALRAGAPDRDAFLMIPDARDQQRRFEELVHDVVRRPETVVHERCIPWGIWMYTWVPSSKTRTGFHGTSSPSIW